MQKKTVFEQHMAQQKGTKFEKLRLYAMHHWGLHLDRNDPDSCGRLHGQWKTGYQLWGNFPGQGFTAVRYDTLKEVEHVLRFDERW